MQALEGLSLISQTASRPMKSVGTRRNSALVEASPNTLLLVASGGIIAMANRQAELTFGYNREELFGQSIELLVPARFRSGHPELCAQCATKNSKARLMGRGRDLFAIRKDGTEVPVEIGLSPIETPEGGFYAGNRYRYYKTQTG